VLPAFGLVKKSLFPSREFHSFVSCQQSHLVDCDTVQALQPFVLRKSFGDEQRVDIL
jgi:hypothetical protein